jgi:hypothetical protein
MRSGPVKRRGHGPFRPRLEVLEARHLPACTVLFSPTAVTITGDNRANAVTISDAGTGAVGSLSVTCDGVTTSNPIALTAFAVNVDTSGGSDSVVWNLTGELPATQARTLTVRLGKGNDFFQARSLAFGPNESADADLAPGSSLSINVSGQAGRDTLDFNLQKDFDVRRSGALAATLQVVANGGPDRDRITLALEGAVNGTMSFALNGGGGPDRVAAFIGLKTNTVGVLNGQVNGQGDDDLLALVVNRSRAFTGTAAGRLNGGPGANHAIVSDFVTVSGVASNNLLRYPA